MEWWLLCWLVLSLETKQGITLCQQPLQNCDLSRPSTFGQTLDCLDHVNAALTSGNQCNALKALEILEKVLERQTMNDSLTYNRFVINLYEPKPSVNFTGLDISASESKAVPVPAVPDSIVRARVPAELGVGPNESLVFCMFTWPEANETALGGDLYENRLIGLSVRGKKVKDMKKPLTINMNFHPSETREPTCVFLDFSTKTYKSEGCKTHWERGQSKVTCSCDHFTYFGVLMVSPTSLSDQDKAILSYITLIGCSLSLFALVIAVLLFITNRKVREDLSMKVHINLAIALILLNLHLIPNQWVAALPITELCFYMAISLHYFLLATFSWMAVEGFHLYLLLVRVFNIYIRRYLLKLSLVGWGIPAVIVSLVVVIDRGSYGRSSLDVSQPNSSQICYLVNPTVKVVTTCGTFGLVFFFNMTMLGVTVSRILGHRQKKEFGQSDRNRAKRGVCTLLGVTTLLGISWGLIFFSFGHLTTPGLYLFSTVNPLQGFFIFLWFVLSWRKTRKSPTSISSVTASTQS